MAIEERITDRAPIIPRPLAEESLTTLCPDLQQWPQRWQGEPSDIAPGERLVECFTAFLLHLLRQGLATKTLRRHRDHLWMLGGEIIRRRYEDPALKPKSAHDLVLQFTDDECGPLIWPRITESQQDSFDATCRKLRQFLTATIKSAE